MPSAKPATKKPAVRRTSDRPRRKRKVVGAGVLDQLKAMIASGALLPGGKLPAERELARQLGVSRPSLRETLRTLAVMGALDVRHGSGTQLAPSSTNVLSSSFEILLLLDQPTALDLYDTRELIEVHLAGRAAERRQAEDLRTIAQALADMEAAKPKSRPGMEANLRFHAAIAVASRCVVFARIMACLYDAIRASIHSASLGADDLDASLGVHRRVYEAIRLGDAEAARQAMKAHMEMGVADVRRAYARSNPTKPKDRA